MAQCLLLFDRPVPCPRSDDGHILLINDRGLALLLYQVSEVGAHVHDLLSRCGACGHFGVGRRHGYCCLGFGTPVDHTAVENYIQYAQLRTYTQSAQLFAAGAEWHHWDFERISPCMETELFESYSDKV